MAIGAGGGIVGCEGVTLLPPGSRWLTLALTCLKVDTRDIDQDFDEDDLLNGKANKKYVRTVRARDCFYYIAFLSFFMYFVFPLFWTV